MNHQGQWNSRVPWNPRNYTHRQTVPRTLLWARGFLEPPGPETLQTPREKGKKPELVQSMKNKIIDNYNSPFSSV